MLNLIYDPDSKGYEVEEIIDKSGNEYLVKYKDYPIEESTWLKEHHLANRGKELIAAFNDKLRAKKTWIGKGRREYSVACLNKRKFHQTKTHEDVLNELLEDKDLMLDGLQTPGCFSSQEINLSEAMNMPLQTDKYSTTRVAHDSPQEEKISSVELMTDESFNHGKHAISWHKVADFMRTHPEACKAHESLTRMELLELIAKFYHFEGVFSLKRVSKENVILEDNSKGFF